MAEIRPFRGVRYNQQLVNDLSSVICPPYDIITPQVEQELYHQSEYNFVRLEHGRQLPQDTIIDNRYTRSAATLEQWLKLGVLKIDEAPAIYLHDHYFRHQGKHISSLLALEGPSQPIISLSTAIGESHSIRSITEPEVINQICANLARQPLYIADGHHRYESALTHQRERQVCSSLVSGDEGFNFVMMTLVSFSDPGLIILPPHRLVRGMSRASLNELLAKLRSFFEVEELPLSLPGIWQQVDDLLAGQDANQVRLILFGLAPEHLYLLRLRDFAATSQMMPYFHCELYKRLDVSIVDHIILEKLLGLSGGREEASLDYSYDKLDAVNRVLNQEYQLAFLLSPVRAEMVKAIADAGDRMPRKSTYFYPKVPAGLVSHRLV
ncbi:hypothetical protein ES703_108549 [subsurface metagenome]